MLILSGIGVFLLTFYYRVVVLALHHSYRCELFNLFIEGGVAFAEFTGWVMGAYTNTRMKKMYH